MVFDAVSATPPFVRGPHAERKDQTGEVHGRENAWHLYQTSIASTALANVSSAASFRVYPAWKRRPSRILSSSRSRMYMRPVARIARSALRGRNATTTGSQKPSGDGRAEKRTWKRTGSKTVDHARLAPMVVKLAE